MARKLKTYIASIGFFDLAVAAPSMKAAAEAWGSGPNLFKWGHAKETDDPAIVAAAMAKPGVVLKRPVGSNAAFKQHAALPAALPAERAPAKPRRPEERTARAQPARKADDDAARKAAAAFAREQKQRERQRRLEDAAREKERSRREQAVAKAEAALTRARARHDQIIKEIASQRDALDRKAEAERTRWENEREELDAALGRARQ
jgi:hypothetical protein